RRKTDARREARRDYGNPIVVELPNEADAGFSKRSARVKREIFAALEKIRVLATKSQDLLCQKHFDPAIRPRLHQLSLSGARNGLQHLAAQPVVDRTPVIGIDKTVVPNLGSLINVRHTGRRQFQQGLRKRIDRSELNNLFRSRKENRQELISR